MPGPSTTILIPTYDRAHYLPEMLDSAVLQDYERLEVLVLDDGSTDATPEILEDYARRYPGRLRWSRHDNVGQARTLNRGFEMIDSEFICLLSSDDLLAPETVGVLVEALADAPDAVMAYPDYALMDADGKPTGEVQSLDFELANAVRLHDCCIGPGALVRRDVQVQVGGWDPHFRYVPDFDFWMRLALRGRFVHVHRQLARMRSHPGSLSTHQNERMADERLDLLRKFYATPDLPDDVLAVRAEAMRAALIQAALVVGGDPNAEGERFVVADRIAPILLPKQRDDLVADVLRKEIDLRRAHEYMAVQAAELERLNKEMVIAQAALTDADEEMQRLHREIVSRDEVIAANEERLRGIR